MHPPRLPLGAEERAACAACGRERKKVEAGEAVAHSTRSRARARTHMAHAPTQPPLLPPPPVSQVIGVDLSPHMVAVGQRLLSAAPLGSPPWVSTIQPDPRAQLRLADAAQTGLPGGSATVVALTLVAHELPPFAFRQVPEMESSPKWAPDWSALGGGQVP